MTGLSDSQTRPMWGGGDLTIKRSVFIVDRFDMMTGPWDVWPTGSRRLTGAFMSQSPPGGNLDTQLN